VNVKHLFGACGYSFYHLIEYNQRQHLAGGPQASSLFS